MNLSERGQRIFFETMQENIETLNIELIRDNIKALSDGYIQKKKSFIEFFGVDEELLVEELVGEVDDPRAAYLDLLDTIVPEAIEEYIDMLEAWREEDAKYIVANDDGDCLGEFIGKKAAETALADWLEIHDDKDNATNYEVMCCEEE